MRRRPKHWRWGRSGPGRPPKPRYIWYTPGNIAYIPVDAHGIEYHNDPIYILPDELEALRLVYLEEMTQEEAARQMGVSRGTLWRALSSGRKKIVQALIERRPIVIIAPREPTEGRE